MERRGLVLVLVLGMFRFTSCMSSSKLFWPGKEKIARGVDIHKIPRIGKSLRISIDVNGRIGYITPTYLITYHQRQMKYHNDKPFNLTTYFPLIVQCRSFDTSDSQWVSCSFDSPGRDLKYTYIHMFSVSTIVSQKLQSPKVDIKQGSRSFEGQNFQWVLQRPSKYNRHETALGKGYASGEL